MKQPITRVIGIAAMVAILAGCDEIKFNGEMEVTGQITVAQRAGNGPCNPNDPWDTNCGTQEKAVAITPGKFPAKAVLGASGGKKYIKLEVQNGSKPTKVQLEFDKNIEVGQTFNITAAQLNQEFGLEGKMDTKVERSQEYSRYEHCTYQYPQTVCRSGAKGTGEEAVEEKMTSEASQFAGIPSRQAPEASNPVLDEGEDVLKGHNPPPPNVNPPHQPTCYTQWVTRPGSRYVRYFEETTLRDIDANFVKAGQNLANYKGRSVQTELIYTYQGECR